MILENIVEKKLIRLKTDMLQISIEEMKEKIKEPDIHVPLDFYSAIKVENGLAIIAEVKKASPSKGIIKENFNPLEISREYANNKVNAISVLTEKDFFMGDNEYLLKIRQDSSVPLLRKDFIIDAWQIYEARLLGADAILLIVSILSLDKLGEFLNIANSLGLHCLVEVHDGEELSKALQVGAKIIGINNRNLRTFEVDLKTTEKLIHEIPDDVVVVSESGIRTYEDMQYLQKLGVNAVLIGETLMRSDNIGVKINELRCGTL